MKLRSQQKQNNVFFNVCYVSYDENIAYIILPVCECKCRDPHHLTFNKEKNRFVFRLISYINYYAII